MYVRYYSNYCKFKTPYLGIVTKGESVVQNVYQGVVELVKVAVFGGGWAGCAAAIQARKLGAEVELVERTDMLLGTGLVGGIVRNNGRFTVFEELVEMGADELIELIDNNCSHKNIDFPKHKHSSLYNVSTIESDVRGLIQHMGIKTIFQMRGKEVVKEGNKLQAIILDDGSTLKADAFVDATGSAGPMDNCTRYGNGCVMCMYRCPTFGSRISISEKAGVREIQGVREEGEIGALSGSCKLFKETLAPDIQVRLKEAGVCIVPLPADLRKKVTLSLKVCQQYAHSEYHENIVLLDCGHVKMMTSFYPLAVLRNIPGFERVRYVDPLAGGVGNSVRLLSSVMRNNYMQVEQLDNLFCAGEKAGLLVGHTEAILTGTLAGYNAVKKVENKSCLELPRDLASGEGLRFALQEISKKDGNKGRYTFSGSLLFDHIKDKDLYTTDLAVIKNRVKDCGLKDIFAEGHIKN